MNAAIIGNYSIYFCYFTEMAGLLFIVRYLLLSTAAGGLMKPVVVSPLKFRGCACSVCVNFSGLQYDFAETKLQKH